MKERSEVVCSEVKGMAIYGNTFTVSGVTCLLTTFFIVTKLPFSFCLCRLINCHHPFLVLTAIPPSSQGYFRPTLTYITFHSYNPPTSFFLHSVLCSHSYLRYTFRNGADPKFLGQHSHGAAGPGSGGERLLAVRPGSFAGFQGSLERAVLGHIQHMVRHRLLHQLVRRQLRPGNQTGR